MKNGFVIQPGILQINTHILTQPLTKLQKAPILLLFTVFLLALLCSPLQAETGKTERWYEVEVIVFANNDKSLQESEKWPEKPGSPNIKNVLELFTPTELLFDDVEKLPMYYVEPSSPGEDTLLPLANKIQASPQYTLLMHRSWRQTVASRKSGIPVYLDDNLSDKLYQPMVTESDLEAEDIKEVSPEQLLLEALLAEEEKMNQQVPETPFFIHELDPIVPFEDVEGLPQTKKVQLTPMGPPNHSLFGTLKLFKNRFLHIAVDFLYRAEPYEPEIKEQSLEEMFPMAKDNQSEQIIDQDQRIKSEEMLTLSAQEKPPLPGVRLKNSKRIRLKEIHYFDHPMFGVIVRTIPYEQPEIEVESIEDSDASTVDASQ